MKLGLSGKIFEKYSYIKILKIRPLGTELLLAGRGTDGHGEANSRFSQFCERA
jgi:hypothetical protein